MQNTFITSKKKKKNTPAAAAAHHHSLPHTAIHMHAHMLLGKMLNVSQLGEASVELHWKVAGFNESICGLGQLNQWAFFTDESEPEYFRLL